MKVPTYDIFSGSADKDAIWLDAAEGLAEACKKMKEYAERSPGEYFVFCQSNRKILASIDTCISADIQTRESA